MSQPLKGYPLENYKPTAAVPFPVAAHAFFSNTNKQVYNKAATKDSWKRVKEFFKRTLK